MARVPARQTEIRNLVVQKTCLFEPLHQRREETQALLLVSFLNLLLLTQLPECSALLVGQRVSRDMLHTQADGLLQIVLPDSIRLPWQSVNQINADVAESRILTAFHSRDGVSSRMPAIQQLQQSVIESLDADAQSVDG